MFLLTNVVIHEHGIFTVKSLRWFGMTFYFNLAILETIRHPAGMAGKQLNKYNVRRRKSTIGNRLIRVKKNQIIWCKPRTAFREFYSAEIRWPYLSSCHGKYTNTHTLLLVKRFKINFKIQFQAALCVCRKCASVQMNAPPIRPTAMCVRTLCWAFIFQLPFFTFADTLCLLCLCQQNETKKAFVLTLVLTVHKWKIGKRKWCR